MSEFKQPRYAVLEVDPDALNETGSGGKWCTFKLYPFDSVTEADTFAQKLAEHQLGDAMSFGGYPGKAYSIDLADSEWYDDPAEQEAEWAEWDDDEDEETPMT